MHFSYVVVSCLICIIIDSILQGKDITDGFLASFAIDALTLLPPFAKTSKQKKQN